MGFADYFLIVWDFVRFAKQNGVTVGPGRGSAAGSLVAYCLQITDLDPIANDLLFERFLNPGRKSMPDIDIDFSVQGRERVFAYVTEKYGRDRVAQIITFSKLQAKASVRDAGRVMGMPYGVVDRIAKLDPRGPEGQLRRLHEAEPGARARPATRTRPRARSSRSRGRSRASTRADSIHAAGVVIGDRPLMEYLPLQQKGAGEAGRDAVHDGRRRGARPAQDGLPRPAQPRRDRRGRPHRARVGRRRPRRPLGPAARRPARPTRCSRAATRSASSSSSRRACATRCAQSSRPCFDDLVALVALYRPGPMQNIPMYARRKNGLEADDVPAPASSSRSSARRMGITVYQEQSMQIAKDLGRLLARRGRRSAQGDRQEDHVADGVARDEVPRGLRGERHLERRSPAACGTTTSARPTTRSTRRTPPATR